MHNSNIKCTTINFFLETLSMLYILPHMIILSVTASFFFSCCLFQFKLMLHIFIHHQPFLHLVIMEILSLSVSFWIFHIEFSFCKLQKLFNKSQTFINILYFIWAFLVLVCTFVLWRLARFITDNWRLSLMK